MSYTVKNIGHDPVILHLRAGMLPLSVGVEVRVPESIALGLRKTKGLLVKAAGENETSLKKSRQRIISEIEPDYSKYSINHLRSLASNLGVKDFFISKKELIKKIQELKPAI